QGCAGLSWGRWGEVVGLMGEWWRVAGVGGSGVEMFGGKPGWRNSIFKHGEDSGSRTYWRFIRVGGITQAYRSFEEMVKDFDREYLNALWRLTNEKFNTAMPIKDKEKALYVELKRLYEPNAADVF
nr:hypothetical protein [Tanacetum cinerariifolium]